MYLKYIMELKKLNKSKIVTCYLQKSYNSNTNPKKFDVYKHVLNRRGIPYENELRERKWNISQNRKYNHLVIYNNPRKIGWKGIHDECRLLNMVPFVKQIVYKHNFVKFIANIIKEEEKTEKKRYTKYLQKIYPYSFNFDLEFINKKQFIENHINNYKKICNENKYLNCKTFEKKDKDYKDLLWIIKPRFSSGGRNIEVVTTEKLYKLEKKEIINKQRQTKYITQYVVQKYIEDPLLFEKRKFDMRYHVLINQEGRLYLYKKCVIRTSSKEYDINNKDILIHLTNVTQQTSKDKSNIIYALHSDEFFPKYDKQYKDNKHFKSECDIMKEVMTIICAIFDNINMSYCKINQSKDNDEQKRKKSLYFQLFGLDIILDAHFNIYFLEINNNPGMTFDFTDKTKKLREMHYKLMDDVFKLTIDKIGNQQVKDKVSDTDFILVKDYNKEDILCTYDCPETV